jgi:esterase
MQMLNVVETGTGGEVPLLIAHGLFGSARNWGVISRRLGETRRVLSVDMRNHANSPRFDSQSYDDMAGDLAEVIAAYGGRVDLLGHSMGGKAAMVLALKDPRKVRRLIVADIAPVAYGHTQSHLVAALQGVDLDRVTSRRDAEAQLMATIPEAEVRAFLLQSLDLKDGPRWLLNLDVLDREMPGIVGFPDVQGVFDKPALFLTGGTSRYVQPQHHARIRALFPQAAFQSIEGAGHWLHAERPREVEAAVQAFLHA